METRNLNTEHQPPRTPPDDLQNPTVHPEDLVDLAASVMEWEHIRHVPVEDTDGRLVGLVSHRALLRLGTNAAPLWPMRFVGGMS